MHCPGCYNFFSEGLASRKDIFIFVKFLKEEYGLEKVTICGGDPLSRTDIFNILFDIKSLNLKINLDTSGLPLLHDESASNNIIKKIPVSKIIRFVDLLGLPVDGPDNHTVEIFRKGRSNYFNDIIKLIRELENYNLAICVNTVVHKYNFNKLNMVANRLLGIKNIYCWQLFQFDPSGPQGYFNRKKYYISEIIFNKSIKKLEKYIREKKGDFLIEPKTVKKRRNSYILVDNGGNVWAPKKNKNGWSPNNKTNSQRIVFGNIKQHDKIKLIIDNVYKYNSKI